MEEIELIQEEGHVFDDYDRKVGYSLKTALPLGIFGVPGDDAEVAERVIWAVWCYGDGYSAVLTKHSDGKRWIARSITLGLIDPESIHESFEKAWLKLIGPTNPTKRYSRGNIPADTDPMVYVETGPGTS